MSSEFWFFCFVLNCVKVLELYWLLTIFKKQNKTIWVVLQRLTLFRVGTKLSSILFIPLNDFGAGTWDFLIYFLFHICSSQHEHEAQWHQGAEYNQMIVCGTWPSEGLWTFGDDDFIELHCSLKYGFEIYANTTLCLDKIFAYVLFLAHFFVFYGYILKSWIIFPRQILQLRANVIQ